MSIEYYKTNKYGVALLYIKDEKQASIVRELTGRKTITFSDIARLTELGCKFTEVLPL